MKQLLKKILLSLLLTFACSFVFGQSYDDITDRIDSLAIAGLPKSALTEVDKLDALAHKNNNPSQIIRAVIYHITFQSYIQENGIVDIINTLRADISRSEYPVKPVLQSLLASMYWQYYNQTRYNFNQRTRLEKPDPDFTKWDLTTLISETSHLYKLSLADAANEQQTSMEVLDGVLTGDKTLRYLRPTLYDLLLQRALSFFLAEEPALTKPRLPFILNNPALFSDSKTFANLLINTTDTASTFYQGLKYLQQATLFHLQKNDKEALADIDLKRLGFLDSKAIVPGKDSLYLRALRGMVTAFSDKPISADALVGLGKYYQQKNSFTIAIDYFQQAVKGFPQSIGGKNASTLIRQIQEKNLSVIVEDVNYPGKPFPVLVNYHNVKSINVKLYKLSSQQLDEYNRIFSFNGFRGTLIKKKVDTGTVYKYLSGFKSVQNHTLDLPGSEDYQMHTTEFKVDGLQTGNYIMVTDVPQPNDSTLLQFSNFAVSRISHVARQRPDGKTEIRVVDRETGMPLKDVSVSVITKIVNNSSKQAPVTNTNLGLTNADGMFLTNKMNYNGSLNFIYKADTLKETNNYIYGQSYNNDEDKPKEKTIFFTDRQIYRPGQVIYFKGIELSTLKRVSKIVPNQNITVNFKDHNNKVIQELKLKTNDFGTFSGTINIPQSILNGELFLNTENGNIDVAVEEYKRPTFTVEFSEKKGRYHLGDSVRVKGKVIAFSGYGLSQAKVAYHVMRSVSYNYPAKHAIYGSEFGYYSEPEAEIKADTITTDSQGNYTVKFKATPGDGINTNSNLTYIYRINADVTDGSGETHPGTIAVTVGLKDMQISVNTPAYVFAKDTARIQVGIASLNGQKLQGKAKIEVYALQAPAQLFKERLWNKPDKYLLSAADYVHYLPGYAYKGEDEYVNWPVKQKAATVDHDIDTIRENMITIGALSQQSNGIYKIVIHANAVTGETDSVIKYVNVFNKPGTTPNINNWVVPVVNTVNPGESAEFLAGTGVETHILMERYRNEELISSQWLKLNQQRSFKIPISEADDDNTAVQFMMVYQNRLYTSYQRIVVNRPDKRLKLQLQTFHNLLQPGQKEQWKMQISGYKDENEAAELLAGLYDASLDDLSAPQSWANKLDDIGSNSGYFSWMDNTFVRQQQSTALVYKYNYYPFISRQYEALDMFGYNYYGGYNAGYRQYLELAKERQQAVAIDKILAATYATNAALVKNGYDITGRIVDETGETIPGVSVTIAGTIIGTNTNSDGYFKIKVPKGDTLNFSFIGYERQKVTITKSERLSIVLKSRGGSLNEVSVIGYGSQAKNAVMASSQVIRIRGTNSLSADTVNYKASDYRVQQNLPADILQGIQLVDNYGDQAGNIGTVTYRELKTLPGQKFNRELLIRTTQSLIVPRKNFAETAFFYPQLHTDSAGKILIDFTIPESLTRWRFKALAHTKDLKTGYIEREIVTQKQLSITANMPRFLREGDTITISARLANLTALALKGKVTLQVFNAVTMQPVSLLVNPGEAQQDFDIASATNKAVSFKLFVPARLDALTYRLTAASGNYSDGEENTLPVLPNRMLVTETMPMMVRAGQTKTFTFDKLVNQQSKTLVNKSLTLEYTQNPAWYAVQALPYMMEFPYECSEQVFSRFYANSLGTGLINKMPVIKQVFDQWKSTNSTELVSNLEKNTELKATLLEETPWLRNAESETEQKKRVALLFDINKMSYELKQNLDKLKAKQLPDGGFPWFGGDRSDDYITRYILAGMGQLYNLKVVDVKDPAVKGITDKALDYLSNNIIDLANKQKPSKNYDTRSLNITEIHSWYTESYFANNKRSAEVQALLDNYLKLAEKHWNTEGIYEQGLIALTMLRFNKLAVTQMITKSLLETAQQSDDMGMYWSKNQLGYYWYQSPIETQSLMIELFTEAGNQQKAVDEMKIWLLRNKQTSDWKTTKATAQACYALLIKGDSLLNSTGTSAIKLNGKLLSDLKPGIKADAGSGYFKTNWVDEQVKLELGKVEIANNGKIISWGALYWQYTENLDKITPSNTGVSVDRKYFIEKQTDSGPILTAVDAQHTPKTGDLLKVVVYLKATRDFDYVQLKDMRPAGTEPVDVLSTYKYQDGLYYYQVTKDVATNFFISKLNKGSYVFEYRLRVVQPGNYSTGISTLQSMYAPEFSAHSEGKRMIIEK